jgi:hypothetical protein
MRIWDIHPGYLNRQSLLGEHREIHGLINILVFNKLGYSKHPETLRWMEHLDALKIRHEMLSKEMKIRKYNDKTPVEIDSIKTKWPTRFIDNPAKQFEILKVKYKNKENGRIPFPKNVFELWAQHKYSVMARDYNLYKQIGKKLNLDMNKLSLKLVKILRMAPPVKSLYNSVEHMWGYIVKKEINSKIDQNISFRINILIEEVFNQNIEYLIHSTALSDLLVWI